MLHNFLRTALRQLWRNQLHTLINLLSLTTGLTVAMFCLLYVKSELSFDSHWPNAERIHRLVITQQGLPGVADGEYTTVGAEVWPLLQAHFAGDYDSIARSHITNVQRVEPGETVASAYHRVNFVDPAFFDIFQLDVVAGSLQRIVDNPRSIAMSTTMAAALGDSAAVGEQLVLTTNFGTPVTYEIAAHYSAPPKNSHASRVSDQYDLLTLIDAASLPLFRREGSDNTMAAWENSIKVWLSLREGLSTDDFNARQPDFVQANIRRFDAALGDGQRVSEHLFYRWQPLPQMHFNPVGMERSATAVSNYAKVAAFAAVGLLILLAGCSNSISLSLAAAIERRREFGIRKAAGALPQDILRQYLGEALLLSLLALLPALALLQVLTPIITQLSPVTFVNVRLAPEPADYVLLFVVAAAVGLASGVYPAWVLSRTRVQNALKPGAGDSRHSSQRLRKLLVGVQFCCAALLSIAALALYVQLQLLRNQPLGFDADNLVWLTPSNPAGTLDTTAFHNELRKLDGITALLSTTYLPLNNRPDGFNGTELLRRDGDFASGKVSYQGIPPDFFRFIGTPLAAGRAFMESDIALAQTNAQTPDAAQPSRVMINEATRRMLNYASAQDAVGRLITARQLNSRSNEVREVPMEIVGVVADSMYDSVQRRPGPVLYAPYNSPSTVTLLRYDPRVEATLQEELRAVVQRVYNTSQMALYFTEDDLDEAFTREKNESRLLLICSAVALILSCTGLFGLAAFTIERNVKEVGVRKVLGATVGSIVRLYLWRFAVPVLLAGLVAWPVAAWFVLQWIERFPYQLEPFWLLPLGLGTIGAILVIALGMVGYVALRAALSPPVRCLRDE